MKRARMQPHVPGRKNLRGVLWVIAAASGSCIFWPHRANAFDSAGDDSMRTHAQPKPSPNYPFYDNYFRPIPATADDFTIEPPDPSSVNGGLRYFFSVNHAALGSAIGDPSNPPIPSGVTGLFQCPRTNGPIPSNLAGCQPILESDAAVSTWGWVNVRKAWNTDHGGAGNRPEHMLITQLAASLGGLGHTRLFEPFWIRYPSVDGYVASPTGADPSRADQMAANFIVGQSLVPAPFDETVSAHATRGISLAEIAQLPDISNSIYDWIAGNEQCPFQNIDRVFSPTFANDACHEFAKVMGSLNMTHFLPTSKLAYTHYHQLALERIGHCLELQPFRANFYDVWVDGTTEGLWDQFQVPDDTEANECEREAFMYEMVAQHFLQDAWSTGHMWKRWGYGTLDQFPSTLGPGWTGNTNDLPNADNEWARKYMMAAVVAAYSGQIHGAKSILLQQAQAPLVELVRFLSPALNVAADVWMDDPLCGPLFWRPTILGTIPTPKQVTFLDEMGQSHPGAGDLFWNPSGNLFFGANISTDKTYREQRLRLLSCAASSLHEVYDNGPKAHGPLEGFGTFGGDPIVQVVPTSDWCWEHWASNESMAASTSPFALTYNFYQQSIPVTLSNIFDEINDAIIDNRLGGVQFSDTDDKEAFISRLKRRMQQDTAFINLVYAANARSNSLGIESAQNKSSADSTPIELLNIPPNNTPTPVESKSPITYFDTREAAQTGAATESFVRQMFWRSHVREMCENRAMVPMLRDRCKNAAAQGGDPDACTACVAAAELHIPTCSRIDSALGLSKCSLLKVDNASNTGMLPDLWFDWQKRTAASDEDGVNCGFPPYFVALHYCTDTGSDSTDAGELNGTRILSTDLQESSCTQYKFDPYLGVKGYFEGSVTKRLGIAKSEFGLGPTYPYVPGPLVDALVDQETITHTTIPECLEVVTSSLDQIVVSPAIAPATVWEDESAKRLTALEPDMALKMPLCGMTQRMSYWNKLCSAVPYRQFFVDGNNLNWPLATGANWASSTFPGQNGPENRCSLAHPRVFSGVCSMGACNSGGVCTGPSLAAPPPIAYQNMPDDL
jgi:hypothetical protein